MPNTETGVFQLKNGFWAFRVTFTENGKRKSIQQSHDEFGDPLKTKSNAITARKHYIEKRHCVGGTKRIKRKTFSDVYKEYCSNSRFGKAYRTIQKQESLWKNHFEQKYGKKYLDEVTVAEINDYLSILYYEKEYAYKYVESFLKMFYLLLGQAYSRNYLTMEEYNKLCVNKDTKIHMPKKKTNENDDIKCFSKDELSLLDEYFKGKNTETAYLLGKYCGLRINECFGLKWSNVDLENKTILIDRQMQYQEGLIMLVPPKTLNSRRVIYLNNEICSFLYRKKLEWENADIKIKQLRRQRARLIRDCDGKEIYSTELVNCLLDGTIQTVNSLKYPSREIKTSLGINFKYHYLRHTYGTLMAEMNTPTHLLCNQMGHGNIHVTQLYYLAVSKTGIEILQNNLNKL